MVAHRDDGADGGLGEYLRARARRAGGVPDAGGWCCARSTIDVTQRRRRAVPGEVRMSAHRAGRPFFARTVRVLAIPIIVLWALLAVSTNAFMPKVEDVAEELAGPMVT